MRNGSLTRKHNGQPRIARAAACAYEALESRRLFSVLLALSGPQTITPFATLNVSADNARSTDGGATFTQFRTIATTSDIYNGTFNEIRGNAQFSLAAGPDGIGGQAVYIAYVNSAVETGNGLDQRITISGSNNAGS